MSPNLQKEKGVAFLAAAALLTAAYLVGIAFDLSPWLRGPEEWRWAYAIPGTFGRLWLPALLLIGYVALVTWLAPQPNRRRLALLAAGLMTPALQLALLYMDHPDVRAPLFYRTVSVEAGGFFNAGAVETGAVEFLRRFPERMAGYPIHPQRHPPGLPLLFALARSFLDGRPALANAIADTLRPYQCHNLPLMNLPPAALASAVLQMIVPFLMGLLVLPLWGLGRALYDEATAVRAALLWPLLPSITLWATRWNQLYALFTMLAVLMLHLALVQRRRIYFWWSGLIVSVASFFSFGNLAIAGFLAIYAAGWLLLALRERADGERPFSPTHARPLLAWLATGGLLLAAGLSAVWLLAWLAWDLRLPVIWRTAMGIHLGLGRSYFTWLFYHLYDFFVFFGLPLFVAWVVALWAAWRGGRRDLPLLAFALALWLLNLSGTSQGEVARVWSFLLPLFLLPAVAGWPRRRLLLGGMAGLLALQLFVGNIFLRTVGTGLSDPPPPPTAVLPPTAPPVAEWVDGPVLQQVTLPAAGRPGEVIAVTAVWTTSEPAARPNTVFVHLLDPSGALAAQHDGQPVDGQWPATCWRPGHSFADSYGLTLPATPGRYTVQLGFYWLPAVERLPLVSGADAVTVGRIDVR